MNKYYNKKKHVGLVNPKRCPVGASGGEETLSTVL